MTIYVRRSCPHCRSELEAFTRDYRAIGPPFSICPNCTGVVRLTHINEWDLRSTLGKFAYIGIVAWTSVLYGFSLPCLYILAAWIFDWRESGETFVQLLFIGIVVSGAGRFLWLKYSIDASRNRLRDPGYSDRLRSLGIIDSRGFVSPRLTDDTPSLKGYRLWVGLFFMIVVGAFGLFVAFLVVNAILGDPVSTGFIAGASILIPVGYYAYQFWVT